MPTLEELRSLESISAANLEDGDYTPMFEASSNRVRPITEAERRKTVAVVADDAPVNETKATLTVNPAGANNSVDYTAVANGTGGEAVSVRYTAPVQASLDVSVAGKAITVACGTKHRMVVTGTLVPDATGDLISAGEVNSHHFWSTDGTINPAAVGAWVMLILQLDGTGVLERWTGGSIDGFWVSSDTGDWPDGLTYVADSALETGTPVVAAALPTAQQVLDAVEASTEATALVTVAANGTVTGAVAAVTAANLAGGVDATTSPAPLIITDDNLYVNTGTFALPVWKEAALSALS